MNFCIARLPSYRVHAWEHTENKIHRCKNIVRLQDPLETCPQPSGTAWVRTDALTKALHNGFPDRNRIQVKLSFLELFHDSIPSGNKNSKPKGRTFSLRKRCCPKSQTQELSIERDVKRKRCQQKDMSREKCQEKEMSRERDVKRGKAASYLAEDRSSERQGARAHVLEAHDLFGVA